MANKKEVKPIAKLVKTAEFKEFSKTHTAKDIANKFGIRVTSIHSVLNYYNIDYVRKLDMSERGKFNYDDPKFLEYCKDHTIEEICKEYNLVPKRLRGLIHQRRLKGMKEIEYKTNNHSIINMDAESLRNLILTKSNKQICEELKVSRKVLLNSSLSKLGKSPTAIRKEHFKSNVKPNILNNSSYSNLELMITYLSKKFTICAISEALGIDRNIIERIVVNNPMPEDDGTMIN